MTGLDKLELRIANILYNSGIPPTGGNVYLTVEAILSEIEEAGYRLIPEKFNEKVAILLDEGITKNNQEQEWQARRYYRLLENRIKSLEAKVSATQWGKR